MAAARAAPRDKLAPNELNWISEFGARHWNAGGFAINAKVTSYEVIDEILRKLARKDVFPNLKTIVVAGHSSGGQFVSRYQMVNRVHGQLGVKVTYLVSNPGAYTYLDNQRPTASAIPPNVSSSVSGFIPMSTAKPPPPFVAYPDARHCTTYDTWPYGLKDRVAYAAQSPEEQLKKQAVSRPTTFLLGELDILPLGQFRHLMQRHGAGRFKTVPRARLREICPGELRRAAQGGRAGRVRASHAVHADVGSDAAAVVS